MSWTCLARPVRTRKKTIPYIDRNMMDGISSEQEDFAGWDGV